MILFPHAKINLGLKVLKKREDGYHDLSTIMYPIPYQDILEILPSDTFEFKQTGLKINGEEKDNLIVRAFELFRRETNISPVYIHLRKEIPMGAGLGGGSADAAFTLRGLNDLFDTGLSEHKLEELAAILGSDCPFFIKDTPQHASGRGEVLSAVQLNLKGLHLEMINPGIHIGTKEAYAGVIPSVEGLDPVRVIQQDIGTWKNDLVNDFEQSVFSLHPELKKIKDQLYQAGAIYAAMSGSGSTMFGLFELVPNLDFPSHYVRRNFTL